jgi:MFS superfamily sulfate permease-like transporter
MKTRNEQMSPDEKFTAIANLKDKLEVNFVALGELLSEIKRSKLFRFKGYETFKDFVEAEYQLSGTLAAKLAMTFDLFIEEMDIDETSVKEIGFERLQLIKPLVQKAKWEEREEWIQKATDTPTNDLRSEIKELKKQEKESEPDLKKVFIDQYMEKMTTWFNCSKSELNFKLALYFQDTDLDAVKKIVKERQRSFELETQNHKE